MNVPKCVCVCVTQEMMRLLSSRHRFFLSSVLATFLLLPFSPCFFALLFLSSSPCSMLYFLYSIMLETYSQEVIVSRMRFISCQTSHPIRFVGLSTALANPRDLADWMGIGDVGVYK